PLYPFASVLGQAAADLQILDAKFQELARASGFPAKGLLRRDNPNALGCTFKMTPAAKKWTTTMRPHTREWQQGDRLAAAVLRPSVYEWKGVLRLCLHCVACFVD